MRAPTPWECDPCGCAERKWSKRVDSSVRSGAVRVLVGTSGYSYKEWKGSFYPEDLAAARILVCIEIVGQSVTKVVCTGCVGGIKFIGHVASG